MDTAALTSGRRISEYVLEERLGRGGFGEVWSARHHAFADRRVAIKVPGSAERAALLKREGALQDRVKHPHAVLVLGMDADHEPPYLVMELVEGESLRRRLEREKRLAPAAAVEIAIQVLSALEHAHARGVVHRDVKPENILLGKDGNAKLTDFGLGRVLEEARARLALSGSLHTTDGSDLSGTVAYMAPEQREPGRATDARVDLYALGIVLFEMLAGVRPEGGEAPSDLVAGLDPRLDAIFRRCYCRVDRRYPSAAAIIADLAPLAGRSALAAAVGPLGAAAGAPAHLVPLRPEVGSPEKIWLVAGEAPQVLDGAARIHHERGAFWITAADPSRQVHVVPGHVPEGRRPDEFCERVGAAPLRLAEGMIVRIGDPALPATSITAYGFHDGPPADAATVSGAAAKPETAARRSFVHVVMGVLLLATAAGATAYTSEHMGHRHFGAPLPGVMIGVSVLLLIAGLRLLLRSRREQVPVSEILASAPPVAPVSAPPPQDGLWGPWADDVRARRAGVSGATVTPVMPALGPAEDWAQNPPAGFWLRGAAIAMDVAFFAFVAEFLGPRTPLAMFGYDWLLTALFGATIGKYICGVRVQTWDGRPPGFARALLRTACKLVSLFPLGLGFALAAVTPGKQALHDFLSGTRSVRAEEA